MNERRLSRRTLSISSPSCSGVQRPCCTAMVRISAACLSVLAHRAPRTAATGLRVRGMPVRWRSAADQRRVSRMSTPRALRTREPLGTDTRTRRLGEVLQPTGDQRRGAVELTSRPGFEHGRPERRGSVERAGVEDQDLAADPLPAPGPELGSHLAADEPRGVGLRAGHDARLRQGYPLHRREGTTPVPPVLPRHGSEDASIRCGAHVSPPHLWSAGNVLRTGCPGDHLAGLLCRGRGTLERSGTFDEVSAHDQRRAFACSAPPTEPCS